MVEGQEYLDSEDVIDSEFYRVNRLKAEEKSKLKLQHECEHPQYNVRCAKCNRVLGSDVNYKRVV